MVKAIPAFVLCFYVTFNIPKRLQRLRQMVPQARRRRWRIENRNQAEMHGQIIES